MHSVNAPFSGEKNFKFFVICVLIRNEYSKLDCPVARHYGKWKLMYHREDLSLKAASIIMIHDYARMLKMIHDNFALFCSFKLT